LPRRTKPTAPASSGGATPRPPKSSGGAAGAAEALVAVAPLVSRWIERLLARHDPPLTVAQYLALRAVAREELSAADLARRTGVSGPAVSQLLAALGGAGLVERRAVAGDRRRQHLALSPAGEAAFRSAEALLRERIAALLEPLPPHEAEALARQLERVAAELSGAPPPRRPPPPRPGSGPGAAGSGPSRARPSAPGPPSRSAGR
jgi:DNA-binding MarR family transcriptional regulator